MTKRSYLNFDLSIELAGDHYRAHVLQSCAGEGSVEFELPFSEEGLENFILKMGHARRSTGRRIRGSDSPEMAAAKQFGGKLFGAVFQGDVYACLRASLDEANNQGQGVRVLMRLPPELSDIPWEYLYNPAWNQFFALSADTPLVRYLELTPPTRPLPVTPPLHLLAVISSPGDYPPLDIEREWRNLQEALAPLIQQGLLEVERLESADLLALQRRLRRGRYHILHFIGHGSFDENAQDGLLLFSDEHGRGKPLSGQYLGTLLHDHRTLRLVVLNACEGARTGREDPFAGAAQSLVQMGLPAVIAMQFEISDNAAILFAQEFYTALADGYPVDAALADARKAIFASNDREWGTPVLFTRTPDGRIFDLVASSAPKAVRQPKPVPVRKPQPIQASPRSLPPDAERLYEDGLSAFHLEDWEQAQKRFQAALEAKPDHAAAAEKLLQAKRQIDLAQRYQQAQEQMAAQDWPAAQQTLEKLATDAPQYRNVAEQLRTARNQARLEELYADAVRLSQAGEWQAVVGVFEEVRQIDPSRPDPDGLLLAAKSALAEAERQQNLTDLYRQALQALEAQKWLEARRGFEQVQRLQPSYRDAARLLEKARAEIARQAARQNTQQRVAPSPARKTTRWPWLAGGLVGFIVLVGMIILGVTLAKEAGLFDGGLAASSQTQAAATAEIATSEAYETQQWTIVTQTAEALMGTPVPVPYGTPAAPQGMVLISAGSFQMGSTTGSRDEEPVHTVNLTSDFYMDIYEVTNAQYAECVAAGECSEKSKNLLYDPSRYYSNPTYANYPMTYVDWNQASQYCAWHGGRLPTEAEWEYAARGGLDSMDYPWGDESPVCTKGASNGAKFDDDAGCTDADTEPVGSYAPNGYGLYDMAGNIWEWVNDWYDDYPSGTVTDPSGPSSGKYRVLRGGSREVNSYYLRVAYRFPVSPDGSYANFGFRCAASPGNEQLAATAQTAVALAASATDTPSSTAALPPRPMDTPAAMEGMVLIPAGSFQMGSDADDTLEECQKFRSDCQRDWFTDEEPVHTVNLTSDFYMDIYEVTNTQYAECVAARECSVPASSDSYTRSSYYANPIYDNYPVIYVSWNQASEYCAWREARLPTEAEWEYAARGGLDGMNYPWGDTFDGSRTNYCDSNCSFDWRDSSNNDGYADNAPVGSYSPNGYGLYDIAGNVWEWVADWYGGYSSGTVTNPSGPASGTSRVLRGGSWYFDASNLRVAYRNDYVPSFQSYNFGFRCVVPAGK